MDDEWPAEKPDLTLSRLWKQDLYDISVSDLNARLAALKAEIERCEKALESRGESLSEAEKLFKI